MMITAENISRSFRNKQGRRKQVLNDLSFEIPAGAHLAILGDTGTGKSTIVNIIGGTDFPDGGRIRRAGTVSWIFAKMRFEKHMSVAMNLRFICRILGVEDFDEKSAFISDLTGLGSQMRQHWGSVSDADRKTLNLAFSLAFKFDIMLFDGPITYGGRANRGKYEPLVDEIMDQSTCVSTFGVAEHVSERHTHVLVLGRKSAQLYDSRQDAIEAFKNIRENEAGSRRGGPAT
ncbi:MAG: ATP-binding cassette domain-containing protein [Alphaproteobacteria bacterium]|nr:MAG: ATP-binding cassette domain-containing protein [Alphaproteobacteria bacterium]